MIARARRSFVLLAVLVLVGSAILVTTGMLFMAQSEIAIVATSTDAARSRALAWSGVQAVMSELDRQRQTILDGDVPRVERDYVIYEDGEVSGLARLLPLGRADEILVPEASKLDLSRVTAETLAATGLVDEETAAAIIAYRDGAGGALQTVSALLRVPGVTVETLYGPIEDIDLRGLDDEADAPLRGRRDSAARGLADVLTVYSAEPMLQRDGRLRMNMNRAWSETLGERLTDRFGETAGAALGEAVRAHSLTEETRLYSTLLAGQVPEEEWGPVTDAFAFDDETIRFGRVDINTAPYEVLAAVPGLGADGAAMIDRARDALSADERAYVTWPVVEGIVSPDAFGALVEQITTRSWTYRFRIAAGKHDETEGWRHPVVYEVVVDLADPRPRIAYLREITLLATAAVLTAGADLDAEEIERADVEIPPEEPPAVAEEDEDVIAPTYATSIAEAEAPREEPEPEQEQAGESSPEIDSGSRRVGRWVAPSS